MKSFKKKGKTRRFRIRSYHFIVLMTWLLALYILVPPLTIYSLSVSEKFDLHYGILPVGFTLEMYIKWFDEALRAIRASLLIAVPTAILTVLIGVPVAYGIVRMDFRGKVLLNELIVLPMIFPPIILAFGLFQLFKTGIFRYIDTWGALVLAHTIVCTPYLIRPLVAALQRIDVAIEDAAASLGASRKRTFVDIVLPMILPSLIAGITFVLARSFSDFEITLLLTRADYVTLPISVYNAFETGSARLGAAVAVIANLFSILIVIVFEKISSKIQWW